MADIDPVGFQVGSVPEVDLDSVEALVGRSLERGSESELTMLGYGEMTLVVGWPPDRPVAACKRLPPFSSTQAVSAYAECFATYLNEIDSAGVRPLPSRLSVLGATSGAMVGYVVQPVIEPGDLVPTVLRQAEPSPEHPVVLSIVDAVVGVCSDRIGLDGQLSNWAWIDGELRYLDVTTPMLFDPSGHVEMDMGVFLAAYPWLLRGVIGRFVAPGIVASFRSPRYVLLDMAANILKERMDPWLPAVLEVANGVVSPPLSEQEVRRFYRSDARMWETLLRLRRIDRWWQRRVRRRTYPFLLPGHIER